MKKVRQKFTEQKLKRKNFLPTLLITVLLWVILTGIIYFVDPGTILAIPLFFILLFLTILFTFSLLFGGQRRGLISAISLTFFLFLAYLGVGNILNFLLIAAIAICIELYLGAK